MQRCAHCGHYSHRNTHCLPRKKKLRRKASRPRRRADKNDKKRGILPTECFIPIGTPRYSHEQFYDTRSIRLLVLLPGSKWEPVRCELVVRSLDNAHYEAISYAWGPEEDRGDILCHDQRLRVPWNLEHALRKFRRLRKKRVVWADSVCINQDDAAERGQQVQNMSKIYEQARRVLVWLGHGSRSHPSVSWCPYSNPSALFEFIRALGPLPPPDRQSAAYVYYQIGACDWKNWATLTCLNVTGWFSRLWVIQELCLASSAIVHYGPASLDWETLASFSLYISEHYMWLTEILGLWIVGPICQLEESYFRNPRLNIPFVLEIGILRACSDPRDRIYAFLGHKACVETIANPHSELFLPVDYSISCKDLYTAVAARTLQSENLSSLSLINFVYHDAVTVHDYEIGSWVPRWDCRSLSPFTSQQNGSIYAAHGQTVVEASLYGNCLSVAGFTFDSVVWVSEIFGPISDTFPSKPFGEMKHQTPHPFVQAWNYIRKTGNSRNMFETMCLLIADTTVRGEEQEEDFVSGAVAYACSMGLDVSAVEDLLAFEHIPYFRKEIVCTNSRYFITSRGWIGMASGATLPADDVCIFFGAPTPFVVRQLLSAGEALYRLCGPCKVPGIMKSEAIKMWERGAFDKATFNLV